MKKILLIPFLYLCGKTIVYKRITTNTIYVKILYRLDTFHYKIISNQFETTNYSNQQVNRLIEIIINKLNTIYK